MSTPDLALLSLVQWLSPAFPTGAFAYSHGLEQAVSEGEVTSEASLLDWLTDILEHGAGWNDAVLLASGLRGEDLGALADLARALAGTAERLKETEEQGAAFAKARAEMTEGSTNAMPLPLPLAVAEAARDLAIPTEQVIALFQHSFASNLVSAGVRFIPLGQAAGQRVLAALHGPIAQIAQRAATATTADLAQTAFRAELQSAAHETLDVRIFKT
ncbi:urease accessory protein [Rhodobacter aestuarii]|uniref:Urease accessory protein UreF n=1 Tax=Rhodobacter aestuarii TaxID=453582 RepID=A0A1N7L2K7_9RHOB|nr:urease accessory UreF family protein [Rhodobacter aestuarii]PTV95419.1 urease accessory protein [Rhodobacter aestuarii]SIS68098.1 urease accessory protein [Rhodobacter aestuarii]